MRLEELRLLAFGPFSELVLELGTGGAPVDGEGGAGPGFHLIYGKNEAGKSTALRAIGDLLFGIPTRTPDAHRHEMKELRIGARVSREGDVLEFVRHKGRKNTLRTPDGQQLDEGRLQAFLGGASRDLFESMFGLDHERLRAGGEALLEGEGEVGASLFEASLGGRSVRAVLSELRAECDALFLAKGSKPRINEGVSAYKKAQTRLREATVAPDKWQKQRRALLQAEAFRDSFKGRLQAIEAETIQLKRVVRGFPVAGRLGERRQRREALNPVPPLPPDAREQRLLATSALRTAERARVDLEGHIGELEAKLEDLPAPSKLAELSDERVDALMRRFASQLKAMDDRSGLVGRARTLREDAEKQLAGLYPELTLETIETVRLTRPQRAAIAQLVKDEGKVRQAVDGARKQADKYRRQLAEAEEQLAEVPATVDFSQLEATVRSVTRQGDQSARVEDLSQESRTLRRRLEQRFRQLGSWQGEVGALLEATLPLSEAVADHHGKAGRSEQRIARLDEQLGEVDGELKKVARAVGKLEKGGPVPTETRLEDARRRRDAQWGQLREDLLGKRPGKGAKAAVQPALFGGASDAGVEAEGPSPVGSSRVAKERADAFEAMTRDADDVADRLRKEAARVAEYEALLGRRKELESRRSELAVAREAAGEEAEALAAGWAALWECLPLAPEAPGVMGGWLGRAEKLREIGEALAEVDDRLTTARTASAEQRARLLAALGEAAIEGIPKEPTVAALLDLAGDALGELKARVRSRERITEKVASLRRDLDEQEREIATNETELAAWRQAWTAAVACLQKAPEPSTTAAASLVEDLTEVLGRVDELKQLEARIEGIDRDGAALEAELAGLAASHAPELAELPFRDAADRLRLSHGAARRDAEARRRHEEELGRARDALARTSREVEAATAQLNELRELAGVGAADDLEAVEERVAEARRLDEQIAADEDELRAIGEGMSLEDVLEELEGQVRSEAVARLEALESERSDLEDERESAAAEVGSLRAGLDRYTEESGAGAEAADASALLASQVRTDVERYVRLRLARRLLEREVERHRQRNQGPVILRANELFAKLSAGSFRELRAELDDADRGVLRCVRANGRLVEVPGLSDGTRDQLYLALRLASLERFAASGEPLPLVLDDLLIHFDDERAGAALEVLGDAASELQILFFTHHARLVELARERVPTGRLRVHGLERHGDERMVTAPPAHDESQPG